jgi:hypothetical protein
MKKNRLQFLKNRPFWLYKFEIKKTESNQIQTEKNRAKQKNTEPNRKNWAKSEKPSQTKKTEPNRKKIRAKQEKTEPNRKNWVKHKKTGFCSKITEPNWNRSIWTGFGSVLILKNRFGYFFLWKSNRTENDHPYLEG